MPTGVAIRQVRRQLFDAAERVLLRAGPSGLTSRAVTAEAGCAKGVLHRHFADFDDFLAGLVEDRAAEIGARASALRGRAGTGTVTGNLADALADLFGTVAVAVVGLVAARDELRARLRRTWPTGVPLLTEAAAALAAYLAAERDLGRLPPDADVDVLAPALVGAGHLLYADRTGPAPAPGEPERLVAAVLAPAARYGRSGSAARPQE
ncbi:MULTISPECIES: TetR/AcrR family transcriptional regulator [Streptomyces]|uniref:TetR/AcrR family transcriptional regulator n=1 Tax=Streptomyces sudanensis TaxID=436397 RepID=A0ABY4T941_9ACTN|nr:MULTISPECIES: TetR/AcrR family transcriptional regulator [Streptomyces]MCP9956315.1 TetR/AcrR family transcriptional regulator [Streptomyces sudanensis]MCP9985524.1 TetR/AcrR family transcriptional regulator [Streptomyces sudanensis]MCQ0003062.1 TetR/AcrR family transcriptional regulator [Streptomyces sudanensis]URN14743.1 TetR/AcrR family transcriptional regulator [Streptomyces sudanensis]